VVEGGEDMDARGRRGAAARTVRGGGGRAESRSIDIMNDKEEAGGGLVARKVVETGGYVGVGEDWGGPRGQGGRELGGMRSRAEKEILGSEGGVAWPFEDDKVTAGGRQKLSSKGGGEDGAPWSRGP